MTHSQVRICLPVLLLLVAAGCPVPVSAALSSQGVIEIIQKSKAFGEGARISAAVAGDEVSLSSFRNKTDTQKDLKIEAVMAAKALMDADAKIHKVTIRFYEILQPKRFSEVTVTASEIESYGAGTLSSEQLLSSLHFKEGQDKPAAGSEGASPAETEPQTAQLPVLEGPLKPERQALLTRIKTLESQGVGVKPFMDAFASIEKLAFANQLQPLQAGVEALTNSVARQETALAAMSKRTSLAAGSKAVNMTGASPPVPPASSAVGPGTNGIVAPPDILSRFAGLTKGRYGWFTPSPQGPLAQDRFMVAERLFVLKVRGFPIERYAALFREMEAAAASGQEPRTELAVRTFWFYIRPNPPRFPN